MQELLDAGRSQHSPSQAGNRSWESIIWEMLMENPGKNENREKMSRGSGNYPRFARNIHSPSLLSTFSSSCRAGEREKYPMVNPIPFLRVNSIPFPKGMILQDPFFEGINPKRDTNFQSPCQILRVEHVQ